MVVLEINYTSKCMERLANMPGFKSRLPVDSAIEPLYYDMGFLVETEDGRLLARAVVYDNPYHKENDKNYLCIGYFLCANDVLVAKTLIAYIQQYYKEKSFEGFVGPMNGSTWNTYRWVTEGKAPAFFLEPQHESHYPSHFKSMGFSIAWEYFSAIDQDVQNKYEGPNPLDEHMAALGISIRRLDKSRWSETLAAIGQLSLDSFKENVFYSPISLDEFMTKMDPLKDIIEEDFFLVAMKGGEIIAYLFAVRDLLSPDKNQLIVKTVARDRNLEIKGIASFLCFEIVRIAKQKGIHSIIHALMFDGNVSRFLSRKFSLMTYRKYGLYFLKKAIV